MTLTQAFRDKYICQDGYDDGFVIPKDGNITTAVTFVGFQKRINQLTNLDLSGRQIELAGHIKELTEALGRVRVLNLSYNYLTWREVVSIVACAPQIKDLILTKNNLTADDYTRTLKNPCFHGLDSLTLGRTYLDWTTIVSILHRIWQYVSQIDLWDCNLTEKAMRLVPTAKENQFIRQIRSLKVSRNSFKSLDWISSAGPLDNLIDLDVSRSNLQKIELRTDTLHQLRKLEVLNISYNDLDDWQSISELYKLKNLKSLLCHENPVYISARSAKSVTIGMLGQIAFLNREEITASVRRDSEIFYLRTTFPEYQSFLKGTNDSFRNSHPRYEELLNLYGVPEDLSNKQLVEKYINVDLCKDGETLTKRLSRDMRVANVKMLCKRLFKLKLPTAIQITFHDPDSGISYELDKDAQTLDFFSVKDGQKLHVHELAQ